MTGQAAIARKTASTLGTVIVMSVGLETFMASVDNSLSVPGGRFLAISSVIPRLVLLVGGFGLLVGSWYTTDNPRAQKVAGSALLVLAVLLLVPPVVRARDLGAATAGLGPGGLLRAKVQVVRTVVCFLALAGLLAAAGRLLIRRSREGLTA